jgi:Dyp-type peroxidase family
LATPAVNKLPFDPAEVQKLAFGGHRAFAEMTLLFLRVDDAKGGRDFLAELLPGVTFVTSTSGESRRRLQIGFSHTGLRRLGLPSEALETFSVEFRNGMAARHRVLGDDPEEHARWDYGGTRPVDVVVLAYAREPADHATQVGELRECALRCGLSVVAIQPTTTQAPDAPIVEHFGFRDGITNPTIEGGDGQRGKPEDGTPGPSCTVVARGEVVLGADNGYGFRTIGPSIDAGSDPDDRLPPFLIEGRKDFGAHGTYLALRKLEQDVPGFWRAMDAGAGELGDVDSEWLAARVVGRWRNGSPVVVYPDRPGPEPRDSDPGMSFAMDGFGRRCPIGAHIRRANPRDGLGDDPKTSLELVARHRLHRRARSYGPRIVDPRVEDGQRRGLVFMVVGASLRRQFEFVQNLWLTNTAFNGLHGQDDPLVGPRAPGYFGGADARTPFDLPGFPTRRTVHGFPRFVAPRGGEYLFLPSRSALGFLCANAPTRPESATPSAGLPTDLLGAERVRAQR